ncbi:MAG: glutathione synthase [Candidatus Binatia bacterium]
MSGLRIGFLMDPIETVIVGHDTTFAFMLECQRRGHEVLYFEQKDLEWRDGGAVARMRRVEVRREKGSHFTVLGEERAPLARLDVLFLRKDPPVDIEFLYATLLADLVGEKSETFIVNDPAALRDANEKLYALRFPDLVPRTLVSRDMVALRAFLDELGGEMVVKPIDGFAGRGVLHVRRSDWNLSSILELMTQRGEKPIIAQAYLPEGRQGDKRVILLDGEPLGAMLRVPPAHDLRGNLAIGGRSEKTTLSERDLEICRRLAPDLRRRGLWFVGLDIIGRYLTEVNVTSPTGIEEINAHDGVRLERQVIDFVERKVAGTAP